MKKKPLVRYQNKSFLLLLGKRCRDLRLKKGLSIDRMTKMGERLSPGAIQRLETGAADVQVSLLYRYAQVLEISLEKLFDFDYSKAEDSIEILPYEEGSRAPKNAVPYYPIEVAAGAFKNDNFDLEPHGWVIVDRRGSLRDFFAASVSGRSMEPTIPAGSICLFKKYSGGSRQGQVLLVQSRGLTDPESGSAFVLKRYKRVTDVDDDSDRSHVVVELISDNPKFKPIELSTSSEDEISTPAVFVDVL